MCINLWNSLYLADPYIPPFVTRGSYIPVVNIGSCHGASRTKSGPSKKPCTYSKSKCLLGDPFAFIPGDIFIEAWNCKHILVLLANSTGKRGSPACSMSRCCRPKSPPPRCAVRSPRDGFWSHKAATSQTSRAIGASSPSNTGALRFRKTSRSSSSTSHRLPGVGGAHGLPWVGRWRSLPSPSRRGG